MTIKNPPFMHTCYLMAWIVEQDGKLVVADAGLYSEAPWSITHHLRATQPVIVEQVSSDQDYHEAHEFMVDHIHHELKFAQEHRLTSVHHTILQMAAAKIRYRAKRPWTGSTFRV